MKHILAILPLGLVFACASVPTNAQEKPDWVDNPYAVCTKEEMCAVGVGTGLKMAKADARSGIAKIFESKIKSSFSSETASDNNDVTEKMRDYLNVETDMLIEAVEIKETYDTPTDYYALAVLNKNTAVEKTLQEIGLADSQMKALLSDDTPASAVKLEKTYYERRGLNQRYIVLTGKSYPEEISYDDVYKAKKSRIGKRHVFLKVDGSAQFSAAVKKIFTENGYSFAKTESEKTPVVTAKIAGEKAYMNVPGFVKYVYHFTLTGPDKKGQSVELLASSFDGTGRDDAQAAQNALEELKTYLSDNILNLSF